MMGRRQVLCGGTELDLTSRRYRRMVAKRAGRWRFWKRRMNRRWRRELKSDIVSDLRTP